MRPVLAVTIRRLFIATAYAGDFGIDILLYWDGRWRLFWPKAEPLLSAPTALEQPTGLAIQDGTTGQLIASIMPVKNTSLYEGRIKGPTGNILTCCLAHCMV